jgi:hypothetical protein
MQTPLDCKLAALLSVLPTGPATLTGNACPPVRVAGPVYSTQCCNVFNPAAYAAAALTQTPTLHDFYTVLHAQSYRCTGDINLYTMWLHLPSVQTSSCQCLARGAHALFSYPDLCTGQPEQDSSCSKGIMFVAWTVL